MGHIQNDVAPVSDSGLTWNFVHNIYAIVPISLYRREIKVFKEAIWVFKGSNSLVAVNYVQKKYILPQCLFQCFKLATQIGIGTVEIHVKYTSDVILLIYVLKSALNGFEIHISDI